MRIQGKENQLTRREDEVLYDLAKGMLYKEIASKQNVSIETIKKHVKNIYKKLNVRNRTEAINSLKRA